MPGTKFDLIGFSVGGCGSDSSDEGCEDPGVLIARAAKQAEAKVKADIKARQLAEREARITAKRPQASVEPAQGEEAPQQQQRQQRNPNNRRDDRPRGRGARGGGAGQPRTGRRNQEFRDGDIDKTANTEQGNDRTLKDESNRPRRNDNRRVNDRRSANPTTGRRANEKRGGAGAGNWGEKTENPEDHIAEESKTPEEPVEKPEATTEDTAAAEEQENKEPEGPPPMSLEEYMTSMNVDNAAPKNIRKANDGAEIAGAAFRNEKIYNDGRMKFFETPKDVKQTNTISGGFIGRDNKRGFFADGGGRGRGRGRGGRDGGRGRGRGGGPSRENTGRDEQPHKFTLDQDNDFPSLGKK